MELPEDVVRWVDAHFNDSDKPLALTVLQGASVRAGDAPVARLLRCAVISSEGNLWRLEERVQHMRVDWRDVIRAAEYKVRGLAFDGGSEYERVYDFNRSIEEADLPAKR